MGIQFFGARARVWHMICMALRSGLWVRFTGLGDEVEGMLPWLLRPLLYTQKTPDTGQ